MILSALSFYRPLHNSSAFFKNLYYLQVHHKLFIALPLYSPYPHIEAEKNVCYEFIGIDKDRFQSLKKSKSENCLRDGLVRFKSTEDQIYDSLIAGILRRYLFHKVTEKNIVDPLLFFRTYFKDSDNSYRKKRVIKNIHFLGEHFCRKSSHQYIHLYAKVDYLNFKRNQVNSEQHHVFQYNCQKSKISNGEWSDISSFITI